MLGTTGEGSPPLSSRLCDAMVAVLAVWTLLCNLAVGTGASLDDLLHAALSVALVAGLVLWRLRRRRQRGALLEPTGARQAADGREGSALPWRVALAATLIALLLGTAMALTRRFELLWWLALVYFLFALRHAPAPAEACASEARSAGSSRLLLAGLAVGFALLPLLVHRRSPDDGFYLNLAIGAVDHPAAPLLAQDSLHGIPGLPLLHPAYQVHSFELLGAAVARVTGLEVIQVCHQLLPCVFSLFMVLALARLCRWLVPERWTWCLVATLCALVLLAREPQSPGYFALLRMHQGKAVFLGVLVPLLLVHGLRYARRPGTARWWWLCAVQIAALGTSSTAIWAGPSLAALAIASGASFSLRGLRTLLAGMSASWYVLLAGAIVLVASADRVVPGFGGVEGVSLVSLRNEPLVEGTQLVLASWRAVFGSGIVSLLCVFVVLAAWLLCGCGSARRLCVLLPLGTQLVFANPYAASWIATHVTSGPSYWRVLWLLPVPLFLGLSMTALLGLGGRRPRPSLGVLLFALVAGACLVHAALPRGHARDLRWAPFARKIEPSLYDAAERLNRDAGAGRLVLAPRFVSVWVPAFHEHAFPLVCRASYLRSYAAQLGGAELERRLELQAYVSGERNGLNPAALAEAIEDYELAGLGFVREHQDGADLRAMLRARGFTQTFESRQHEIWTLDSGG